MAERNAPVSRREAGAYTYMLECSDGTLYTGYTVDLDHRMAMHNAGKASRYTRCRLPARLVYYECFATKSEAMKRERAIKRLTRSQKLALIAATANECNNFY